MASGAIFDAIKTYVTTAWSATPIRWENEHFEIPTDSWVDVEMSGNVYGQESIGASIQSDNRWDESGTIWLHINVPVNTGGSLVRTYAKQVCDMFKGVLLLADSLEFRDMYIGRGHPGEEDGNWFTITVQIEFRRIDG